MALVDHAALIIINSTGIVMKISSFYKKSSVYKI